MQKRFLCAAFLGLTAAMAPCGKADAQTLPAWKITDICAVESAPGQCAAFEGIALKAVSASWPFVLDPIKQACLTQVKAPGDRSWRLLSECLDSETRKALDSIAVHTARTPAEPVPPPKPPAPSADAAPAAATEAAAPAVPPPAPAQAPAPAAEAPKTDAPKQ